MDRYKDPYMGLVMTPPEQEESKYDMYVPKVSTMKILNPSGGLGDLPSVPVSIPSMYQQDWITPVVVIVVSAMALMTLYAVLSKR